MEASELYCLPISPIVVVPFALDWSRDNHVSLVTHGGVHIFELVPHPMCIYPTFRFWRTFVHPSEYLPTGPFQNLINGAIVKMKREDVCTLLMQPAITTKIDDRTDVEPRILRATWSPPELVDSSKCLLAILTSAGSVEILYKLGSNWLSLWNLSHQWYEIVKKESGVDPETMRDQEFEKLAWVEHVNRLLGTAIAWSPIFHDFDGSAFAYFVSVFRSNDLVISRVARVADLREAKEPIVVHKTKLKSSVKTSELLWLRLGGDKHVIVVGYADGRIHGLRVTVRKGIFGDETLFRYHDHTDRIIPSSIKFMSEINGRKIVLVTKGFWLLVLSINDDGECLQSRHLRIGDSFLTGLIIVSREKIIVTSQCAEMYAVTISESAQLSYEPLKHDLKSTKVHYLGLTRSPNSAILVNVTSPDAMHDHLINREPSTLQLFGLSGDEFNPWRIVNLSKNPRVSLRDCWDCLESIRVRAARSPDSMKELPTIPRVLDGLTIHKLRIVMWLTLISQVQEKKQMLKGVDKIVGEISEAQPLIFLLSACELLRRLAAKSSLSADEKRCVCFLRMYMEIYVAGEEDEDDDEEADEATNAISRAASEVLALTSHVDGIETEACNLCGEIISDLPWTIDRCPAGHKLPRCSVTLLQITTMRYRTCPVCGRMFHPSLDEDGRETRCLYCDVPAQYDIRVISNGLGDVESRWRNLSKRLVTNAEQKTQDEVPNTPAITTSEKAKRRGMNPHTFAVIVNRDDDDSMITETWQEF